ncbi:MAG TPA: PhzF family phenazine biosynthesis protein, partial [Kofleriaceae bacterium]|nr:PhzF family phenazine biosynthesis protein [Kofleriaceae bacterium]
TAFFVPRDGEHELRWFTPVLEIDLCGHATLASAFVLFTELGHAGDTVRFRSPRSGPLPVRRTGDRFTLDFPALPSSPRPPSPALTAALGREPAELHAAGAFTLAVYASAGDVRALAPDMAALMDHKKVIASAPGDLAGVDFVSRFFAPYAGVPEDPVTGSAHCVLTPYWARRLGKSELSARQISRRGGDLHCVLRGDRVDLSGRAALYLRGTIRV